MCGPCGSRTGGLGDTDVGPKCPWASFDPCGMAAQFTLTVPEGSQPPTRRPLLARLVSHVCRSAGCHVLLCLSSDSPSLLERPAHTRICPPGWPLPLRCRCAHTAVREGCLLLVGTRTGCCGLKNFCVAPCSPPHSRHNLWYFLTSELCQYTTCSRNERQKTIF